MAQASASENTMAEASGSDVVRLITLGDGGVGKTSIIGSFCGNKFVEQHLMTLGVDHMDKTVTVDGKPWIVQLVDTIGQDQNRR